MAVEIGTAEYDLRGAVTTAVRALRTLRAMSGVIVVLFAGMLAFFVVLGLSPGGLESPFQRLAFTVIVLGLGAVVAACLAVLSRTRAGPSFLALSPTGLNLRWQSGGRREVRWEQLPHGFRLVRRTSPGPGSVLDDWSLARWDLPRVTLTEAAVAGIREGAKAVGLDSVERRDTSRLAPGVAWISVAFRATAPDHG